MTEPHRPPYTRADWPIAAAMIQYPNILPDGGSVQEQSAEAWAATLDDVVETGFTELDPTDSWLRVADLSAARLDEFLAVVRAKGLTIPAISTARRSVIDAQYGDAYLAYGHRVIDVAPRLGARSVSFGLFQALTDAQKRALWFWTVDGHCDGHRDDPRDDPRGAVRWQLAVSRIRELGRHAAELGIEISLEMYEDTFLGTADDAVRLVTEIDLPNVGINADLGNLVRLHRPVEHWREMMRKVAPYAKYWHVKNYTRTEDATTGLVVTAPAPLEFGVISYREAIRLALAHGFDSPFLVEHYGGDGLGVSATNRDYLRKLLPRTRAIETDGTTR